MAPTCRACLLVVSVVAVGAFADEATVFPLPQDRPSEVLVKVNGRQVLPSGKPVRVQVSTRTLGRIDVNWQRSEYRDPSPPLVVWAGSQLRGVASTQRLGHGEAQAHQLPVLAR